MSAIHSHISPAREAPWRASVLTLFPQMFPGPLGLSLAGQALEREVWRCEAVNIRDYASDRHGSVDDSPAGGGAGMVMRADVAAAALDAVSGPEDERIRLYPSPRGKRLDQALVAELAAGPGVVLFCGRFEGVDERFIEARGLREVSLGDFVLSGGEIAAMALLDAVVRTLPGVMGSEYSLAEESFSGGLLEYPHYTRPRVWEGRAIPAVLLSGDHGRIRDWRQEQAMELTRQRRPDLWRQYLEST
jgi:tRNA (guanine37-N1)-methyltransferase